MVLLFWTFQEAAAYTAVVQTGPNVNHTRERRYVDAPNRIRQSINAGPASPALVHLLLINKTRVPASVKYARFRKGAYSFTSLSCHYIFPPAITTVRTLSMQ
jgi:hypothetical protein